MHPSPTDRRLPDPAADVQLDAESQRATGGGSEADSESIAHQIGAGSPAATEATAHSSASRRRLHPLRILAGVRSAAGWLWGLCSLVFGLALVATLPGIQLLSLGYLLEAGGRLARGGTLRAGIPGIDQAKRLGSMVAGTWICLLPLRFVSNLWYESYLISPDSDTTRAWRVALWVATILGCTHIAWAWIRGGRFRDFLWPAPLRGWRWLRTRGKLPRMRDALWEFVESLRLPQMLWLGARGFCGAAIWLAVPITLFIGATTLPGGAAVISGLVGSLLLGLVVLLLPFLQMQFAASRQWRDLWDWRTAAGTYYRAPIAAWLALFFTLLFALPLYLLKIELTSREVALLPSIAFVVFMLPARLIAGWSVHRGRRSRPSPRRWLRRMLGTGSLLAAVPVVGFYLVAVFLTRYTSWYGVWSMLEQHAFLVPVPFLGL